MSKRLRRVVAVVTALVALGASVGAWLWTCRPGLGAYAAHRYAVPANPGALTATWFGVTALLLSDGAHSLFIDPFFTRPEGLIPLVLNRPIAPDPSLIDRWLASAGISHLDAVLVSHTHFDHSMDAGAVAKRTGAVLIGSESTANVGRGSGLDEGHITIAHPGQPIRVGSFTITFVESRHAGASGGRPTGEVTAPLVPPARYFDYKLGGAYSILIEHPEGDVLHHGSAGFVANALAGRHADVVFLGVALIDDLDVYLHEVVDPVGTTRVVPTHWDDFTRPLDQPLTPFPFVVRLDQFFDEIARLRPALHVETLEVGRPVALFPRRG